MSTIEAPDLHVLAQTAAAGRFSPNIPEGDGGDHVRPHRASFRPRMTTRSSPSACPCSSPKPARRGRLGVLEIDQGRYRFRMLEGRLSAEEQAAMDGRLDEFQRRFAPAQA